MIKPAVCCIVVCFAVSVVSAGVLTLWRLLNACGTLQALVCCTVPCHAMLCCAALCRICRRADLVEAVERLRHTLNFDIDAKVGGVLPAATVLELRNDSPSMVLGCCADCPHPACISHCTRSSHNWFQVGPV